MDTKAPITRDKIESDVSSILSSVSDCNTDGDYIYNHSDAVDKLTQYIMNLVKESTKQED